MGNTTDFTMARAVATRDVEMQITDWFWEESTLAPLEGNISFAALVQALQAAQALSATADVVLDEARGVYDGTLAVLKKQTQTFVALAKVKFRDNAGNMATLRRLQTSGTSRSAILQESLDAAEAWAAINQSFMPTAGMSLVAFRALRVSAQLQQGVFSTANVAARNSAEALKTSTLYLDKLCKVWYAAATRIFDESTTQGALIRSQIPTRPPRGQSSSTPPPMQMGNASGGGTTPPPVNPPPTSEGGQ